MGSYDYSVICRHTDAETEPKICEIKGTLPDWIEGTILYDGPALTKIGSSEFNHTFDCSALLQKFKIQNGNITYSTRFVQSETYKRNKKENTITVVEFGTPGPAHTGILSRLKNSMDMEKLMSDNAVLTVQSVGARLFALGETPYYLEIDPETMDVVKRINMNKVYSLVTQSGHVMADDDGFYYTSALAVGLTGLKYTILRFPSNGDVEKGKAVVSMSSRWRLSPCYVHSVAMTKNYVVLIETPLAVSLMELLSDILTNTPFIEGLQWREEEPTLFHLIDRNTWKPLSTSYVSDPFFFLHFANAYEQEDQVVVDVCAYKDSSLMQNMLIKNLRHAAKNPSAEYDSSFCAYLRRFVLPLNVSTATEGEELVTIPNVFAGAKRIKNQIVLTPELYSSPPIDMPIRNARFSQKGNRFVWGVGPSAQGANYTQAVKVDLKTKEAKVFNEEGMYTAPLVFIPSPASKSEDAGVVACLLISSADECLVTFLVLDAASLQEICRATLPIKVPVPMPLHGHFTPI